MWQPCRELPKKGNATYPKPVPKKENRIYMVYSINTLIYQSQGMFLTQCGENFSASFWFVGLRHFHSLFSHFDPSKPEIIRKLK